MIDCNTIVRLVGYKFKCPTQYLCRNETFGHRISPNPPHVSIGAVHLCLLQ